MYELLWTIIGAAVAVAATQLWQRVYRHGPNQSAPTTIVYESNISADTRLLALGLAEDLANLISGVESRAHYLIEAAPTREWLPEAAEQMSHSLSRMRRLHTKLVACGHGRQPKPGTTHVSELIDSISGELQQMQLGLEIHWEPPPGLPPLDADLDSVRDALLFLSQALLCAEKGATRFSFVAERSFSKHRPTIRLEMTLEWVTASSCADVAELTNSTFTINLRASHHLIGMHGGDVVVSHLPGKSACAIVRLPMAIPAEEERQFEHPQPQQPGLRGKAAELPSSHDFGGALVLESDPTLRAVLSRELKASGRAVFACVDGDAAHSFLEATPDRFEVLFADDLHALEPHTPLGRTIRERAPWLKICLLTVATSPPEPVAAESLPDMHSLQKPFGVHELRTTLASILTTG